MFKKVYVSYFYQIRFFDKKFIPLSTAVWDPKWYHQFTNDQDFCFYDKHGVINGLRVSELMPGDSCVDLCRGKENCSTGNPGTCEFLKNYRIQLDEINIDAFFEYLETALSRYKVDMDLDEDPIPVFIVHEAPDNPCSERVVIMQWLKDNGIDCEEWHK